MRTTADLDGVKRCPRCGETKLISEFHRCKARKDGVQFYCAECMRTIVRRRTARRGERIVSVDDLKTMRSVIDLLPVNVEFMAHIDALIAGDGE